METKDEKSGGITGLASPFPRRPIDKTHLTSWPYLHGWTHGDIAAAQTSFRNHWGEMRAQNFTHGKLSHKFSFGIERRLASAWKVSLPVPERGNGNLKHLETQQSELLIKAVATFEPKLVPNGEKWKDSCRLQMDNDLSTSLVQLSSSNEDTGTLDDKEKLRRTRISKANKGNTPWNKGRKHSADTLQKIRERTRLAMQDPKVKMKLINLGHAQSKETRLKIGAGVRMGWERRRQKMTIQETCHFDWQNLIAEAARSGYVDEVELQWDSYKILDKQLVQEWVESVEQRKKMPRPAGSKRAPKSAEQRRKISEAISAKWADPGYRDRVCSALSKYHGTTVGGEKKQRRRPSGDKQPRSPKKKEFRDTSNSSMRENKSQVSTLSVKRTKAPIYKDPFSSQKLEMLKNIRAQRAAEETKKVEAVEQAKLLIAEAEKAAKALEVAATRSPLAQASLVEAKRLIAEATQIIEAINMQHLISDDSINGKVPYSESEGVVENVSAETASAEGLIEADPSGVNGRKTLGESIENAMNGFHIGKFSIHSLLDNNNDIASPSTSTYQISLLGWNSQMSQTGTMEKLGLLELNQEEEKVLQPNGLKVQSGKDKPASSSSTVTKKWVRGRLVEIAGD
ncbi:Nuclease associated modular domain 3 [Dillenia turbinata]|uniref:Nuclease associated modular domain 3 n=1 Tax=Dillenia turbinata TaxID=194707 RepID=A0AAN8YVM2_9MAGN